jgi:hypothetical protein
MDVARTGEVVWYVTGRFYKTGSQLFDVGYFLHLQGVAGNLALLTFAAEPFGSRSIDNGGLSIGIDERGTFSIYLRATAGASFDDPTSFAEGIRVATFSRVAMVPTTTVGTLLQNVFTAQLVSSEPFELDGVAYDFRELVGYGITQWGTADAATDAANGVPFVGSAIRVG